MLAVFSDPLGRKDVLDLRIERTLPRHAQEIKDNSERIRGIEAIALKTDLKTLKAGQTELGDTSKAQAEALAKLEPLVERVEAQAIIIKAQGDQIHALRRKIEWAKGWAAGAAIGGGLLGGLLVKLLLGG